MLIQPKAFILASAIVLLSGCAVFHKPQNDTNATSADGAAGTPSGHFGAMNNPDKTNINWLFRYYRLISTVTGTQLADEYEKTRREFSEKRTLKSQWQLAILLSIPSTPFYDAGRSSDLFKELTNNDLEHDSNLNNAAFLIYTLVNEQYRIGRKSDTIEVQLIESQAANKPLQDKIKSLEAKLTEVQSVNQTLQDQINALKAIEDALDQRNRAEDKPKP